MIFLIYQDQPKATRKIGKVEDLSSIAAILQRVVFFDTATPVNSPAVSPEDLEVGNMYVHSEISTVLLEPEGLNLGIAYSKI